MAVNKKQDRQIYLILSFLSWMLVFAIFITKNVFMLVSNFVLLILIDVDLINMAKRISPKNNRENKNKG